MSVSALIEKDSSGIWRVGGVARDLERSFELEDDAMRRVGSRCSDWRMIHVPAYAESLPDFFAFCVCEGLNAGEFIDDAYNTACYASRV